MEVNRILLFRKHQEYSNSWGIEYFYKEYGGYKKYSASNCVDTY